MGVLSSTRSSDATKIGMTDDWDIELEADIAEIFGIQVDKVITSPIFAVQSIDDAATIDIGNGGQVNSDGSITGVVRLAANVATAAGAAGVEFQSSAGERFKLCAIADNLNLYLWNDDPGVLAWELQTSLNLGTGSFLGLSDVYDTDYVGKNKWIPVVMEDEVTPENSYLRLMAPSAGEVSKLVDLDDVETPDPDTDAGKFLKCWSDGIEVWFDWETPAGDGTSLFSELDDVLGWENPLGAADQGAVAQVVRGAGDPAVYAVRPVFTPGGYSLHKYAVTGVPTVLGSTAVELQWERVTGANPSDWGDNKEGGDMSSFMFADPGSGTHRYSQFKIPARFTGFYDIYVTLDLSAVATKPVEVELFTTAPQPPVFLLQTRRLLPPCFAMSYNPSTFQITAINGVAGKVQAAFQVLVASEGGSPPTFYVTAKLAGVGGGTGTVVLNSSGLLVVRRA